MFKSFPIITVTCIAAMSLAACARQDPTLAPGVQRKGDGLYSISEMGNMFMDIAAQAVEQCRMDGNKKLSIVTSTTQMGIVDGRNYAVLLFRCNK